MITSTLPERTSPDVEDDDFEHYYCCNPNVAFCGADVTDDVDVGDDFDPECPCPMCEVLLGTVCPTCGQLR